MSTESESKLKVLMLLFNRVTILDFIAPYEIFRGVSNWEITVVGPTPGIIRAEGGLGLEVPESIFDHNEADILFIPGGAGINDLIPSKDIRQQIAKIGENSKYVTSVCTGSLLLAVAGLLRGFDATTHWRFLTLLPLMGARAVDQRVVVDRNRITAGGITSGMDFALQLVQRIVGEDQASKQELWLQYQPSPPMGTGHPSLVSESLVHEIENETRAALELRRKLIEDVLSQESA